MISGSITEAIKLGRPVNFSSKSAAILLQKDNYTNQSYSPIGEQVNKFINELSSAFALAVSRVQHLLDAWNLFDHTVPKVLKITVLPNTMECSMNEETGNVSLGYIKKRTDAINTQTKAGGPLDHLNMRHWIHTATSHDILQNSWKNF